MTRSVTRLLLFAAVLAACTPLGEEGSSISRGDQAFAHGDLQEALAEYRLAERLGGTDAETYARIAHTYVGLGRIDEAREYYRLAVDQDSEYTEQAVADFVHLARSEEASSDEFGMASAVQTALEFRPGISLEDLALPLAQHYSNIGEHGRALPFYQKTLSALDPDSLPGILFEIAIAYDEVGDCESAAIYYEDYRNRLSRWRRGEVDWRLGNCSFRLARTRRAEGRRRNAAVYDEILADVGGIQTPVTLPRNQHVYNQYTLKAERRDELRSFLTEKGIGNGLYYPLGLHLQECFAGLGGREGELPVTEALTREVVSLPIFPELTEGQLTEVGEAIRAFFA